MAKKTVAAKKRNVKIDGVGQLHVHSSFNNIIVCLAKQRRPSDFMVKCRKDGIQRIEKEHTVCSTDGSSRLRKGCIRPWLA